MDTRVACPMNRVQKTTIRSHFFFFSMFNMEKNSSSQAWKQVPSPA